MWLCYHRLQWGGPAQVLPLRWGGYAACFEPGPRDEEGVSVEIRQFNFHMRRATSSDPREEWYLSPYTWAEPLIFHTEHRGVSLVPASRDCLQQLPASQELKVSLIFQRFGNPLELPNFHIIRNCKSNKGPLGSKDNLNTAVILHPKIKMHAMLVLTVRAFWGLYQRAEFRTEVSNPHQDFLLSWKQPTGWELLAGADM